MQENEQSFIVNDPAVLKRKMLNWANQFNIFCLVDNCVAGAEAEWEWMLAAEATDSIQMGDDLAFTLLNSFCEEQKGKWIFGHLGYSLYSQVENITPETTNVTGFGDGFFFVPAYILVYAKGQLTIHLSAKEREEIWEEINNTAAELVPVVKNSNALVTTIPDKQTYLQIIQQLQQHIQQGDCYEINFCRHHLMQTAIDPLLTYEALTAASPSPFSTLYKLNKQYAICASPERYLKKTGSTIISQPIKGTARRHRENAVADEKSKAALLCSEKDKSENVMVVDLVRNDLSRVCMPGSVQVSELQQIYSFSTVHHMISTVEGKLQTGKSFADIVQATFPMGSMTGAPKKKVMELIQQYEPTGRGLFSGSIGYIQPDANFNFNVVIRSIFYDAVKQQVSFYAGGAITIYSNAEQEWEECELKTKAIMETLGLV